MEYIRKPIIPPIAHAYAPLTHAHIMLHRLKVYFKIPSRYSSSTNTFLAMYHGYICIIMYCCVFYTITVVGSLAIGPD